MAAGRVDLVIRRAEVAGGSRRPGRLVDVAVSAESGTIVAVGESLPVRAGLEIDARCAALIPGLHDHHIHLLAVAATANSVDVSDVTGPAQMHRRITDAEARLADGHRLRVVGYHHRIAGDLDRDMLDAIAGGRPLRVGDRGGARWTLNSAALAELPTLDHPAVERDAQHRPTGRVHRGDDLLRVGSGNIELALVGQQLTRCGITGVTDATPYHRPDYPATIAAARRHGALRQHVTVCGAPMMANAAIDQVLRSGPVKIIIDDASYPSFDELVAAIGTARDAGRSVALHCVTRSALALALAALGERPGSGDRVEHGSVITPEAFDGLRALGLTVVTQPAFVARRGDDYLAEVEPADVAHLYRCASLIDAGIPVAASTDAPYSPPDPWQAIDAAVHRRTTNGAVLGHAERVDTDQALALFLGSADRPGGPARRVAAGQPADLCLLDAALTDCLAEPCSERVTATVIGGRVVPC